MEAHLPFLILNGLFTLKQMVEMKGKNHGELPHEHQKREEGKGG